MASDWDLCTEEMWDRFDLTTLDGQREAGRYCGKFGKRKDLKKKQGQAFLARVEIFHSDPEFAQALQRSWDYGFSIGYSYFVTIMENQEIDMSMKDECKFNKSGWIVINWMEDGLLQKMKFDTVSAAKSFYCELKKKGLK